MKIIDEMDLFQHRNWLRKEIDKECEKPDARPYKLSGLSRTLDAVECDIELKHSQVSALLHPPTP